MVGAGREVIAAPDLTWVAELNWVQAVGRAVCLGYRAVRLRVDAAWRESEGKWEQGRLLFFLA